MTTMKHNTIYTVIATLCIIASSSCSISETGETENVYCRKISVRTDAPEVKSVTDPASDMIYLYTFGASSQTDGVQISPSEIKDGKYTYYIPENARLMVFTNLESGHISPGNEDNHYMNIHPDFSSMEKQDLVIGKALDTDLSETGELSVHLTRYAAFVTASLEFTSGTGTVLDLSEYITDATVSVSPVCSDIKINGDYSITTYGEGSFSATGSSVSAPTTLYTVADQCALLPSPEGTAQCEIAVTLNYLNGTSETLKSTRNYAIEANKHYKLIVKVKRRETGFGFTIEDIIKETIDANLN